MNTARKLIALWLVCFATSIVADDNTWPSKDLNNTQPQFSPRIIGGNGINIEQYPATAALLSTSRVELDGNLRLAQFCAGTVIASRWVLTAAHCVSDLNANPVTPGSIQVLTGSSVLNEPVNQPIQVVRVFIHSEFVKVELGQDIALLELEIDAQVPPAPLAAAPAIDDEEAFVAGWGGLNTPAEGRAQTFPDQLQGTFVNLTPGESCATRFPVYADYVNGTMICAGAEKGGHDSCQGDSGGPLYRTHSADNSALSIVGITSWGVSCGLAEAPGVYTNVASYIDWIESTLEFAGAKEDLPTNDDTQPAVPEADNDESSSQDDQTIDSEAPDNDSETVDTDEVNDETDSSNSDSSAELPDSISSSTFMGASTPAGILMLVSLLFWRRMVYRTHGKIHESGRR